MKDKIIRLFLNNLNKYDNGCCIASPTTEEPNYLYHWTRDSAICMLSYQMLYENNLISDKNYIDRFIKYINFEYNTTFLDVNRGEPKFNINCTKYNKPWGRPQNDGPALRIICLYKFYLYCLENNIDETLKLLYNNDLSVNSLIKKDLEYICHTSFDKNFDLWEEINDNHLFTKLVQREALKKGIIISNLNNDIYANKYYLEYYDYINNYINYFKYKPHINPKNNKLKKNMDSSIIIGYCLCNLDIDDNIVNFCYNLIKYYQDNIYINEINKLVLIGRYPDDKYYGNNPWLLCTIYLLIFMNRLTNKNHIDKILSLYPQYYSIRKLINDYIKYIYELGENNEWSEQIDENNSKGISAKYLTWNFASLIQLLNEKKCL